MSQRKTAQWVTRAKRRRQARIAGRLEAVLDILEHTDIHPRRKAARLARRAAEDLDAALRSMR